MKPLFAAVLLSAFVGVPLRAQQAFPPPEFVPSIGGISIVRDFIGDTAVQQKTLYTIDVPASIDPNIHHPVTVWGVGREVDFAGKGKRSDLTRKLTDAFKEKRYELLASRTVAGSTVLTFRGVAELDETWVEAVVDEGKVNLRETRSTIPKGASLGEAAITAEMLRRMTQNLPPPVGEPFTDADDFPFLRHVPGLSLLAASTRRPALPMTVLVGSGMRSVDGVVIEKVYRQDRFVTSSFRSMVAYDEGLKNAGWKVSAVDSGILTGIVHMHAHYDRDGQDLWAHLIFDNNEQRFTVADAMATTSVPALRDALARGRASIYGLHVDKDGAIDEDSKSLLDRVAEVLRQEPARRIAFTVRVPAAAGSGRASSLANGLRAALIARGISAERFSTTTAADLTAVGDGVELTLVELRPAT